MKGYRTVLAAGFAVGAACTAMAQSAPPPDISGSWKFKTVLERKGCTIHGDIMFNRTGPSLYSCSFVSQETCSREQGEVWWRVEQTCAAVRVGNTVSISSAVVKVLEASRPEFKDVMSRPGNYRPDNFTLNKISTSEMTGSFYSRTAALVRFWRVDDLVS